MKDAYFSHSSCFQQTNEQICNFFPHQSRFINDCFFYLRSDSMIICLYDPVRMRQYQSLSPHSSLITHSHCDQQFHTKFSLLLSLSNLFLLFDLWHRAILRLNNPKTGKNVSVRRCPRRMPYLESAMQLY